MQIGLVRSPQDTQRLWAGGYVNSAHRFGGESPGNDASEKLIIVHEQNERVRRDLHATSIPLTQAALAYMMQAGKFGDRDALLGRRCRGRGG